MPNSTAYALAAGQVGVYEQYRAEEKAKTAETARLPENPDKQLVEASMAVRRVTAYNTGDINQCWGDPCIAANGENICQALDKGYKRCAANFVPFGTILEIEGYGQCQVTDRMNARYPSSVDIAMKLEDKQKALDWGRQYKEVKVMKYE